MTATRTAYLVSLILPVWLMAAASAALANDPPLKTHHDIDITLDPEKRTLSVRDEIRTSGSGRRTLHLSSAFIVTAFSVDGKSTAPLHVGSYLETDLGKQGSHTIRIDYKGRLAAMPAARSSRNFDSARPMASATGAYLPENGGWYPRLGDQPFSFRLTVQVPHGQKAVSIGRLSDETQTVSSYRATFTSESPTDSLILLAGPYEISEMNHNGVLLRTYFDKDIAALAPGYLQQTQSYLDLYRDWIGAYPFTAFHIVSSPLPVGFGYAGLTYIGSRVLRLPFIRFTSLGHEVLHNWWGNGVGIDYRSGNWAEGLTTYMADYHYAAEKGPDKARQKRLDWLRDFAALPADRDRPVTAFVSKHHDAAQIIGYNKVAFIFHMLQGEIGKTAFDEGLRLIWRRYKFHSASWALLRAAFEETAGRPLAAFFDQWLSRTGAPGLSLEAAKRSLSGGPFETSFTLRQPVPAYALKVPVVLTFKDGTKGRHRVNFTTAEQRFTLTSDRRPVNLSVDPDFDLFRRLAAGENPPILRDITLEPGTATFLLTDNDGSRKTAASLARQMLDAPPRFAKTAPDSLPRTPLLIIGTRQPVMGFLHQSGLGKIPPRLDGKGSARVWTGSHEDRPFAVVMADNAGALAALLRPLPHYGRKSYLIFEGSKALETGVWPPQNSPLSVALE